MFVDLDGFSTWHPPEEAYFLVDTKQGLPGDTAAASNGQQVFIAFGYDVYATYIQVSHWLEIYPALWGQT